MTNNSLSGQNVVMDLYWKMMGDAIAHAESGTMPNPNIRTTVQPKKGSSAYGRFQITGGPRIQGVTEGSMPWNIAYGPNKDYMQSLFKRKYGPTHETFNYYKDYVKHAEKLLDYGGKDMVPGYEHLDYGGPGELLGNADQIANYNKHMMPIIKYEVDRAGHDPYKILMNWKGGGPIDGKYVSFDGDMNKFSKWIEQNPGALDYTRRFFDIHSQIPPYTQGGGHLPFSPLIDAGQR